MGSGGLGGVARWVEGYKSNQCSGFFYAAYHLFVHHLKDLSFQLQLSLLCGYCEITIFHVRGVIGCGSFCSHREDLLQECTYLFVTMDIWMTSTSID